MQRNSLKYLQKPIYFYIWIASLVIKCIILKLSHSAGNTFARIHEASSADCKKLRGKSAEIRWYVNFYFSNENTTKFNNIQIKNHNLSKKICFPFSRGPCSVSLQVMLLKNSSQTFFSQPTARNIAASKLLRFDFPCLTVSWPFNLWTDVNQNRNKMNGMSDSVGKKEEMRKFEIYTGLSLKRLSRDWVILYFISKFFLYWEF